MSDRQSTAAPVRAWSEGAVRWLEIDRPEALNAIDGEVMRRLAAELDQIEAAPEVTRVVVLTGGGERCFIAGGDLKEFSALTQHDEVEAMARQMRALLERLEGLPCWVIAAINGDAYGGGCETLVACDWRVMAHEARLGWTQGRFAVPCGWGGMTRLVELVGRGRAMALLANRQVVSAHDALAMGLVHEVVEDEHLRAHTRALAERLARQPRELVEATKQGALRAARMGRAEAMEGELEPFVRCWLSEAHHQAVARFMGRQKDEAR